MNEDLANRFMYHAPNDDAKARHEKVREILGACASAMSQLMPPTRELSLVHTKLEEAMFWANAGIARNHDKLPPVEQLALDPAR